MPRRTPQAAQPAEGLSALQRYLLEVPLEELMLGSPEQTEEDTGEDNESDEPSGLASVSAAERARPATPAVAPLFEGTEYLPLQSQQSAPGEVELSLGNYVEALPLARSQVEPGFTRVARIPNTPGTLGPDVEADRIDPWAPIINEANEAATTYNEAVQQYREDNTLTTELLQATQNYFNTIQDLPVPPGASDEYRILRELAGQEVGVDADLRADEQAYLGRELGFDNFFGDSYTPFSIYGSEGGYAPGQFTVDYLNELNQAGELPDDYLLAEDLRFDRFEPGVTEYTARGLTQELAGYSPAAFSHQLSGAVYDPFAHAILNRGWAFQADRAQNDLRNQGNNRYLLPDAPYVMQGFSNRFSEQHGDQTLSGVGFDPTMEHTHLGRNPAPRDLRDLTASLNRTNLTNQTEAATLPLAGTPFDVPLSYDSDGKLFPDAPYEVARGFDQGREFLPEIPMVSAAGENLLLGDREGVDSIAYRPLESGLDEDLYAALDDVQAGAGGQAMEGSGKEDSLAFLGGDVTEDVVQGNLQRFWDQALANRSLEIGSEQGHDVSELNAQQLADVQSRLDFLRRPFDEAGAEYFIPRLPGAPDEVTETETQQQIRPDHGFADVTTPADDVRGHVFTEDTFSNFYGDNQIFVGNALEGASNPINLQETIYLNPQGTEARSVHNSQAAYQRPNGSLAFGPSSNLNNFHRNWLGDFFAQPDVQHNIDRNLAELPIVRGTNDRDAVILGNLLGLDTSNIARIGFYPNELPDEYQSGQSLAGNLQIIENPNFLQDTGNTLGGLLSSTEQFTTVEPELFQQEVSFQRPGDQMLNGQSANNLGFDWVPEPSGGPAQLHFGDALVADNNIEAYLPSNALNLTGGGYPEGEFGPDPYTPPIGALVTRSDLSEATIPFNARYQIDSVLHGQPGEFSDPFGPYTSRTLRWHLPDTPDVINEIPLWTNPFVGDPRYFYPQGSPQGF